METSKNDTGLQCLTVLLRFHQVAVDPAQIAHEYSGEAIGVAEMLRCAKQLKLKARGVTENWAGLTKLPLPAIVEPRSGGVVIVGKVSDEGARPRADECARCLVLVPAGFQEPQR